MGFIKQLFTHAEVKRGGAHLLVGVVIGVISTLLTGESAE